MIYKLFKLLDNESYADMEPLFDLDFILLKQIIHSHFQKY